MCPQCLAKHRFAVEIALWDALFIIGSQINAVYSASLLLLDVPLMHRIDIITNKDHNLVLIKKIFFSFEGFEIWT